MAGKFLGFIIHENGIEVDPKRIEAMRKVEAPTCKKDLGVKASIFPDKLDMNILKKFALPRTSASPSCM